MSEVTTELSGGVLTVTISRPDKKNALTNAMYGALADALEQAEASAEIRVLVFQADGEIFSAGNDLGEFAAQSRNEARRYGRSSAFCAIWSLPASRWWQRCRARRWAWVPPCCCIAIWYCWPTMPN